MMNVAIHFIYATLKLSVASHRAEGRERLMPAVKPEWK